MSSPMGCGFFIFFHNGSETGGRSGGAKEHKSHKFRKVRSTKDVYKALQQARETVETIDEKAPAEQHDLKELNLIQAEIDVSELLAKKYTEMTQQIAPPEALDDFVSELRFDKDLDVDDDMEPILLILLIDELTDD